MSKLKLKSLIKEAFEGVGGIITTPAIHNLDGSFSSKKTINEGTRWNVGIEEPNGKVTAVYGHYDGYPQWVGKILKSSYSNSSKVKLLLKLGKNGISTLDKSMKGGKDHSFDNPQKGETVFYGRDRGEKGSMTMKYKNIEEFGEDFQQKYGAEYGYIWSVKNKKWTMFDYRGNRKEL